MEAAVHVPVACRQSCGRPTIRTPALSLSLSCSDSAKVVTAACRKPSDVGVPVTHWSAGLLAGYLQSQDWSVSESGVRRILQDADLQPHRQKMWLTSQDEEFRAKRDDVLQVYYDTPKDEHIICLDEMTGMQILERLCPDIPMVPGMPIRREFEYKRHGTLSLMGALDVRRGKVFGFVANDHASLTFVELLDVVARCYPQGRGHLIFDNLFAHDTDDVQDWFDDNPRWKRHFTPKHASWLNQVECRFGIIQRRVLRRGSFQSPDELVGKLYDYMLWHNQSSQPFRWSYRPKSWSASTN